MKWVLVEPQQAIAAWRVRGLPIVDRHVYCGGEIIETIVQDTAGRFWVIGDWVSDTLAYRVAPQRET